MEKIFISLMLFGSLSFAQSTPVSKEVVNAEEPVQAVEKITVTGSHIKRIQIEGPSPLQVLDREYLDRTGYNSVSDVLRDVTTSSFGSALERSSRASLADASEANLRGLGAKRTLVLLNGRRLVADPIAESVDLNLIPMPAVERVEILKDGASALYGADAVGGVINIITKKDFSGHALNASSVLGTQDLANGDRPLAGSRFDASYVYGKSTDKYEFLAVLSARKNEKLFAVEREPTEFAESISGDIPVTSIDGGSNWDPGACPADRVRFGQYCAYNFLELQAVLPTVEQYSTLLESTVHLTPETDLVARVNYSFKKSFDRLAPLRSPNGSQSFQTNSGAPNERVYYRLMELGTRDGRIRSNYASAMVGLKTEVFDDWGLEADVSYSYADRFFSRSGFAKEAELRNLFLDQAGIDPSLPAGSRITNQALFDQALATPFQDVYSSMTSVNAIATGELTDNLALAFGSNYFYNNYEIKLDPLTANGEIFGSTGAQDSFGERGAAALFGELVYNPAANFEVQAALRFDHFDDFGGTLNPKLAFRYQPSRSLMFRGSAGTGYKAPTLQELYGAGGTGTQRFTDQVFCDTTPSEESCNAGAYTVTTTSNQNLEPEEFLSVNMGALLQLGRDHSIGIDLFMLEMDNTVSIDYESITRFELQNGATALRDNFGIDVSRDANGRLNAPLITPFLNLGELKQFGADLNMQNKFGTENWGMFNLSTMFSYIFKFEEQRFPGLGFEDTVGEASRPAWRSNIILTHTPVSFPVKTAATVRVIGEHECIKASDEVGGCKRSAYAEIDLQSVYEHDSGTYTFGVQNILDTVPPLDDTNTDNPLDRSLYRIRGRTIFIGYQKQI